MCNPYGEMTPEGAPSIRNGFGLIREGHAYRSKRNVKMPRAVTGDGARLTGEYTETPIMNRSFLSAIWQEQRTCTWIE